MTRIPGLDAWLTREGPEHTCDPHAPFSAVPILAHKGRHSTIVTEAHVYDDRNPDAPPVVVTRGTDAGVAAAYFARCRNRQVERAAPPNEDGPGGSCTVCGDFHGEPQ